MRIILSNILELAFFKKVLRILTISSEKYKDSLLIISSINSVVISFIPSPVYLLILSFCIVARSLTSSILRSTLCSVKSLVLIAFNTVSTATIVVEKSITSLSSTERRFVVPSPISITTPDSNPIEISVPSEAGYI